MSDCRDELHMTAPAQPECIVEVKGLWTVFGTHVVHRGDVGVAHRACRPGLEEHPGVAPRIVRA